MLSIYEVARQFFLSNSSLDRRLFPSEASVSTCSFSLADFSTMTGRERIAAFQRCGIDPSLFPLFLRALQHITAIHGSGSIDDNYRIHRHLSAHQWSPFSSNTPLLGYPHTNSEPFRDCCPDDVDLTKKNDSTIAFRADIPYNGLLNQGATCYLNSLLQALFHISAFRSIIYEMPTRESADDRSDDDRSTSKSIPYALQRLFCMLQTSSKAVGTTELTESFGWSASDSFIQHDVHELTRVLLDNLQKKLSAQSDATDGSATNRENAIHRLFHGCLESYIKVEEANYYGSREEPFYDLQLVVKNTKNIYTSLDTFFQVEVLDGKNRYCLEQNGKKSYHRAEKGVRLKQTPPIMLLHLTRFDYDVQRGESKVFTRWDYYNTLDLSRYMPDTPVEKTHYTLCSVLVHSGSTTGFGHYFCFLLCSGAWYKFNDEVVSPASLKEVFGDNFGGFKINFWGSEVPHTNNAYMLVYVRTSEMDTLLRPISASDVPRHVMDQIHREQIEQDRQVKERAVDYLYGRVHFVLPPDVVEQPEVLSTRRPVTLKVSTHRTLRVLLESEALPEFLNFVEEQLGIAQDNQLLWFASLRRDSDRLRLYAQVRPGMKVRHILDGDKECCILVTTKDASIMTDDEPSGDSMYQIFHHKLYDPLHLRVHVLGSTVVLRSPDGEVSQSLELMKPFVRQKSSLLPDESSRCRGHHLKGGGAVPHADDLFENSERELSTVELSVVREDEYHSFLPCDKLSCGDILVWQYNTPPEDKESVFYANIEAFQHFLRRKIPVVIKLNSAPTYPVLLDTELADDMTYEQLQRYVARLVGDLPNFDRIRFTRHNPDTELPYFMKGKKRDRPTLAKLLTPATTRVTTLSRILYYEYCKYTVTEIESAHSLQFKLYSDCVKRLGSHWVLMPREVPITARDLFSTCLREIIHDLDSGDVNSPSDYPLTPLVSEGGVEAAQDPFISFLQQLRFEDAWKELRLVDVWRGRIYNVFDGDRPLVFEHHTFEESAEYRVERIPQPVCGVPLTEQFLLQVYHFTMVRQRKDPVETHSEPFSFYIAKNELPAALLRRIADKLEVSLAAVQDWKLCLVREKNVVEVQPDIPMGVQIQNFCSYEQYQLQKEPLKSAFLGLEHAPTSKRTKREERVVIFN